jgi:hypothetical protein
MGPAKAPQTQPQNIGDIRSRHIHAIDSHTSGRQTPSTTPQAFPTGNNVVMPRIVTVLLIVA